MHRFQLADERARPIAQHISDRHVVGNAEGEVQIGEAIAAVHGKRAHGGPGDDTLIVLRECRSSRSRRASRCATVNTTAILFPPGGSHVVGG